MEQEDENQTKIQKKNIETILSEINFDNSKEECIVQNTPLFIPKSFFNSFVNINKLVLTDCNLDKMPRSILKLTNLNYLDLSNNNIEFIPIEIGQLRKLTTLKYENNKCRPLTDFIHVSQFKDFIEISQYVMDRQSIQPPVREILPYDNKNSFKII